jgi:hypothetical protein
MAQFNLNDYETVEERLRRFWAMEEYQDARIETVNHTTPQDRAANTWVVEARIYLDAHDQHHDLPKATGWAFEVDGQGMANKTSALENCETSAIGRCLANMNLSGNKRVTREEMAKVQRGVTPLGRNWLEEAKDKVSDLEALRLLYSEAKTAGAAQSILNQIKELANGQPSAQDTPSVDS